MDTDNTPNEGDSNTGFSIPADMFSQGVAEDTPVLDESGKENEEVVEEKVEEKIEEVEKVEETVEKKEEVEKEVVEKTTEEDTEGAGEYGSMMLKLTEKGTLSFKDDKEYSDDDAGAEELIQDNIEMKSDEKVQAYKDSLGDEANRMLKILEEGGSVDQFQKVVQQTDYASYPLEDADGNPNVANQNEFIKQAMEAQGVSPSMMAQMKKVYEADPDARAEAAEEAKDSIIRNQEENNKAMFEKNKAEKALTDENNAKDAEEFKAKVSGLTEIKGFKLKAGAGSKLHDYITKPVDKEGNTAFMLDDNDDVRLLSAYFAMNKYDVKSMTKDIARKEGLKIKKTLNNFTSSGAKGGKTTEVKQESGTVDPGLFFKN